MSTICGQPHGDLDFDNIGAPVGVAGLVLARSVDVLGQRVDVAVTHIANEFNDPSIDKVLMVDQRFVMRPVVTMVDIARGLTHVHGEGGPRVFGEFVGAGVVNELCVTVAPWIVAGEAPRIAHSEAEHPTRMTLTSVLRQGSEMFLKYRLYKR